MGTTGGQSMIMAYTQHEYDAVKEQVQILATKVVLQSTQVTDMKEEIEILRAERTHWHHMYNNNVDERPDI